MRIIFICGSLEPGRDGVGDYTRRLAGELIRQGYPVAALALNDFHILEPYVGQQHVEGQHVSVVRLPATLPYNLRFRQAKKWIDDFDPKWLSLQYVPFSFHSKGLSFGLKRELMRLGKGRCWHIMFHELWVGMDAKATIKEIWWGKLQRFIIQRMISSLHPSCIHTQCQLYLFQLKRLGVNADYLPLFTNIPLVKKRTEPSEVKKDNGQILLVLFGAIHPGAPIEQLADEAAALARDWTKQINLVFIGRCGSEQEHWVNNWRRVGLTVTILGERTPEFISDILKKASLGIATTPIALAEKSGSVAAMLSHELPVICVSKLWQPHERLHYKPPSGVVEYTTGNLRECFEKKYTFDSSNSVEKVSHRFMNFILAERVYGKSECVMESKSDIPHWFS